ncbi:MAG: response regulator [Limisphaerales bacterium]
MTRCLARLFSEQIQNGILGYSPHVERGDQGVCNCGPKPAMNDHALILIIEDDDNDELLIRRAFRKAGVPNPCKFLSNGEQAIAYLKGEGRFANRSEHALPGLILLDLKLPGMGGLEVLHWIRSNAQFKGIRVVVTTASTELRDVTRAYQLGANSFLTKPLEFENRAALITTLEGQGLFEAQPVGAV